MTFVSVETGHIGKFCSFQDHAPRGNLMSRKWISAWVVAVAGSLCASARGDGPIIGENGEIYDNANAHAFVMAAHKHDPNHGGVYDRERAAHEYEQAILAQPGAKLNATLANRIAQMYAFNLDPAQGIKRDFPRAVEWWKKAAEFSEPTQILWVEAHMGMANAQLNSNSWEAIRCLDAVLSVKPEDLKLDNWRAWPVEDSESARNERENGLKRNRELLESLQPRAGKSKEQLRQRLAEAAARRQKAMDADTNRPRPAVVEVPPVDPLPAENR